MRYQLAMIQLKLIFIIILVVISNVLKIFCIWCLFLFCFVVFCLLMKFTFCIEVGHVIWREASGRGTYVQDSLKAE